MAYNSHNTGPAAKPNLQQGAVTRLAILGLGLAGITAFGVVFEQGRSNPSANDNPPIPQRVLRGDYPIPETAGAGDTAISLIDRAGEGSLLTRTQALRDEMIGYVEGQAPEGNVQMGGHYTIPKVTVEQLQKFIH